MRSNIIIMCLFGILSLSNGDGFTKDVDTLNISNNTIIPIPDTVLTKQVDTSLAKLCNSIAMNNYEIKKTNELKQSKVDNKLLILESLENSLDSLD